MSPSDHEPENRASECTGTQRRDQVVAEFLAALEACGAPDRGTLLESHSDLLDDLRAFFAEYDRRTADDSGVRPRSPARSLVAREAATIPPELIPRDQPAVPPTTPKAGGRAVGDVDATTVPRGSQGADSPVAGTDVQYFGDYELLEEIARGGMGVVYRARQISLNRPVALKMILAGQLASEQDVRRFHSEAQAAAHLSHPGIVPIYEVGEHEGQHYFSMGLVEGENLADTVAANQPSPEEAARLVSVVAEAVQYAHDRGVIHRDLKPANVLIDNDNEPRVTDFGLAKTVGADSDLTATGAVLGTPSYMAPEQACGTKEIGPAADIYSLGAILYALLTGAPPFRASSDLETILQVIEQEPSSPRRFNRAVSRKLEAICLKCLEKDPRRRYASAQELADDLKRYLEGEMIVARPLGPWGQLRRWARSRPALAATLVALSLFYVNHLIAYYGFRAPGDTSAFHLFVTGLMLAWGATAVLFQYLARRPSAGTLVVYGWAGMDVVMFSFLLAVADGPRSTILFGYLLLVGGAALRFRIGLVWFVTLLSMLGYLGLVLETHGHRPHLAPEPVGILPFLLGLFTMGLIGHFLLLRVRKLCAGDSNGAARRTVRSWPLQQRDTHRL